MPEASPGRADDYVAVPRLIPAIVPATLNYSVWKEYIYVWVPIYALIDQAQRHTKVEPRGLHPMAYPGVEGHENHHRCLR